MLLITIFFVQNVCVLYTDDGGKGGGLSLTLRLKDDPLKLKV